MRRAKLAKLEGLQREAADEVKTIESLSSEVTTLKRKLTRCSCRAARADLGARHAIAAPDRASAAPAPVRDGLTGPEQRILDAIVWLESVGVGEPEQPAVAFLAGYSYGGGAYNNPRGRPNQRGLVEYRPAGGIRLTHAGRELANVLEAPATNEALHERVPSRLGGPEQRLLRPLLREACRRTPTWIPRRIVSGRANRRRAHSLERCRQRRNSCP